MRRTTSLTTAVLAGLAPALVLLTPSAATGAGETCRGEAATIVGVPGTDIVGTEGRDVVVTSGSEDVDTRGGDDLVCVTGPAPAQDKKVRIQTGSGNDVVDGTTAPVPVPVPVSVTLGTGSDRFEGGDGHDYADAGPSYSSDPSEVDDAPDVLLGGGGDDILSGAQDGLPVSDVLDGGPGNDRVSAFRVPSAGATLRGGPGRDHLETGTVDHALAWDMAGDVLRVGDSWSVAVSGFEDAFLAARDVEMRGTDDDNEVMFVGCDVSWRGRGGDDHFRVTSDWNWEEYKSCGGDTVMIGGAGDDRFSTYGPGSDRLVGGRGNDAFNAKGGRDTILGGPGRDTATAGRGADRFVGGPGKDRVDGEQGRDRCRAERERRCER